MFICKSPWEKTRVKKRPSIPARASEVMMRLKKKLTFDNRNKLLKKKYSSHIHYHHIGNSNIS